MGGRHWRLKGNMGNLGEGRRGQKSANDQDASTKGWGVIKYAGEMTAKNVPNDAIKTDYLHAEKWIMICISHAVLRSNKNGLQTGITTKTLNLLKEKLVKFMKT